MTRLFIQARMSSKRFPGKVLAPFRGEPIILHVLRAARQVAAEDQIVVLTSTEASDDPLAAYLASLGVQFFRGPLDDVYERFRLCLKEYPGEWLMRLSADSPLLDAGVLKKVISFQNEGYDLVTTILPRTFPKGQNAEIIRVSTFLNVNPELLTPQDREHVLGYFYRHANQYRIFNVESENPELAQTSLAVDTLEDFKRLEARVPWPV